MVARITLLLLVLSLLLLTGGQDSGASSPGTGCATAGTPEVWATGNTRKVLPEDAVERSNFVWNGERPAISLQAARNEHEAFQLVICSPQALSGVDVNVSALTGSADVISSDRITLYREVYFDVQEASDPWGLGLPKGSIQPGPIPDALIPFFDPYEPGQPLGAPFSVAAGHNEPVWVVLDVPSTAAPGDYQGTIAVIADNGATTLASITLNLQVWNFTLPASPSLDINFAIHPYWTLSSLYGIDQGDETSLFAMTDEYYEALLDRRLAPWNFCRNPIVSEGDGQVQVDFDASDSQYEYLLEDNCSASAKVTFCVSSF